MSRPERLGKFQGDAGRGQDAVAEPHGEGCLGQITQEARQASLRRRCQVPPPRVLDEGAHLLDGPLRSLDDRGVAHLSARGVGRVPEALRAQALAVLANCG